MGAQSRNRRPEADDAVDIQLRQNHRRRAVRDEPDQRRQSRLENRIRQQYARDIFHADQLKQQIQPQREQEENQQHLRRVPDRREQNAVGKRSPPQAPDSRP